jgi:L-iditol 2-dehydrogenase
VGLARANIVIASRISTDEGAGDVPLTMRALVLEEPGCIKLTKVEVPQPGPGEVLVKVSAACTCGTDLKAYLRGHPQIPMPGLFGHEYSGVVAEVGEGAPFRVGQAVMGVHSAPCQMCFWCSEGQENLCESIMATKVLGTYAEYLRIPAHIARLNLFEKPEQLSFEEASLLEPLACVAQGISLLKLKPEMSVLVIGPGAIGLMFVAALRSLGVENITLAGRNKHRLEVGEHLGARTRSLEEARRSRSRGFDLVVECTGSVEVWEASLDYVRRGGTVVLFGGCAAGTKVAFDTRKVHYDQINMVSPFHFGTDAVRTARRWLIGGRMDLRPLLSGERSLEDGKATFEDLKAGTGIKYVFKP